MLHQIQCGQNINVVQINFHYKNQCDQSLINEIYMIYQLELEEVGPIGINHMRFNIAIENLVRDTMATHQNHSSTGAPPQIHTKFSLHDIHKSTKVQVQGLWHATKLVPCKFRVCVDEEGPMRWWNARESRKVKVFATL